MTQNRKVDLQACVSTEVGSSVSEPRMEAKPGCNHEREGLWFS